MGNVRTYGEGPFEVALVHGGPGAVGEMAPVARELSANWGVIEPLQTATTLPGQVEELKTVLQSSGAPPIVLVGFSWGAWLSLIVSARYARLIKKLILVGSGPFEQQYVEQIQKTRMDRLTKPERVELETITTRLADPTGPEPRGALARLGALAAQTDTYDAVVAEPNRSESVGRQANTFRAVWAEAQQLRRDGKLLALAKKIRCPVVAIHGDDDPHPAKGVREPLCRAVPDFRFIPLAKCGHKPWVERHAREAFYSILKAELSSTR